MERTGDRKPLTIWEYVSADDWNQRVVVGLSVLQRHVLEQIFSMSATVFNEIAYLQLLPSIKNSTVSSVQTKWILSFLANGKFRQVPPE